MDEQERQIREYAKRNNFQLNSKPYIEVQSAKDNKRPIFNQMINDMRHYKPKGLILHKLDRFARNFHDAAVCDDLVLEGFEIHFVADNLNSTQSNWGFSAISFGIAKYYLHNLKQEIHKGINGMVEDGRSPMSPPLGYCSVGRGNKEPDPIYGRMVCRAFEIFSNGDTSIEELRKKLTDMGLKTKATTKRPSKVLPSKALYKILRNPFYYGFFRFKGGLKKGSHKALISKKLFDQVQEILDDKSYKHHRKFVYQFSGLLKCRVCGKPLRSISSHHKYRYYACRNLDCKCNIREEWVENEFAKQLQLLEFDDKEAAQFLKAVQAFREDLKNDQKNQIQNVDLETAKLKNEKSALLTLCLNNTITENEFKVKNSELLNKEQDLCERRMALERADSDVMDYIIGLGKMLKRPTQTYRKGTPEEKRQLIKSLVETTEWKTENGDKSIVFIWKDDFKAVANRQRVSFGGPGGNRTPD